MLITALEGEGVRIAIDLHRAARPIFFAVGVTCSLLLVWCAASQYVVARLTNERFVPAQDVLLRAERYLPASGGLQAKLAEVETLSNPAEAQRHALNAVNLSPYNYKHWLTLASVNEKQKDVQAAEHSLRSAVALSPANAAVRLRLAKLLGEQARMTEAIAEFRQAALMDHSTLAAALDFVWRKSNGDVNSVELVTNDDPRARLVLAYFLLNHSHAADAARVFAQIKDKSFLDSSEGASFLNTLMTAGYLKLTHDAWAQLVGSTGSRLIWNGGFEQDRLKNFTHFDWTIDESGYARIAVDEQMAHTGQRSLRIEFGGREASVLNNEIRQLILLNGGTQYRVECYAKSDQLISPQGPRLVVNSVEASVWLGTSTPLREGTSDWQLLSFDFVAPQSRSGEIVPVLVTIKQTPVAGHNDPTLGTVWFDDFTLTRFEN